MGLLGVERRAFIWASYNSLRYRKNAKGSILRSHLIEPATLWNDDFEAFFELRTQALLDLISTVMGKSITPESIQVGGGGSLNGNGKVNGSRLRGATSQTRAGV